MNKIEFHGGAEEVKFLQQFIFCPRCGQEKPQMRIGSKPGNSRVYALQHYACRAFPAEHPPQWDTVADLGESQYDLISPGVGETT